MPIDWSTVLTITGAFGAAATAQVVSHRLTQKREEEKYLKECLQKLYSPSIFRVLDYLNLVNSHHSFDDQVEDLSYSNENLEMLDIDNRIGNGKIFDEILENIGENLMYASNDIIMVYEDYRSHLSYYESEKFKDDVINNLLVNRFLICNVILSEYIQISKKLRTYSKKLEDRLIEPYLFTELLILIDNSCESVSRPFIVQYEYAWVIHALMEDIYPNLDRLLTIKKEFSIAKDEGRILKMREARIDGLHFLFKLCDEFPTRNFLAKEVEQMRSYFELVHKYFDE